MKKLWQKNWKLNKFVEYYEAKDDVLLDQQLLFFDVLGSLAHAKMLGKIGILNSKELEVLSEGLYKIILLNKHGEFTLSIEDEDIHTKIENYLTKLYGEVGKKIHTGRSRNDQVLTALRLYTKSNIFKIWQNMFTLADAFVFFAIESKDVLMPGYTHMQKAMPYTFGAWAESFISGIIDDLYCLETSFNLLDQSPLGSAAAFGTPLPIDKSYTAKLLGFSKVQENTLYCQNSRGKLEAIVISSLISILGDLNKFASDVLLFTTSEFSLLNVHESICTGSSIMPQKKNVDIAELIRSKVHVVLGFYTQVASLSSNLISGYNRDLQDMKKPLFESLETTNLTIQAAEVLIKSISPNKELLTKALTPEVFATHKAFSLTMQGTPFREAYNAVGKNLESLEVESGMQISIPSNINKLKEVLKKQKKTYQIKKNVYEKAIENLLKKGGEQV